MNVINQHGGSGGSGGPGGPGGSGGSGPVSVGFGSSLLMFMILSVRKSLDTSTWALGGGVRCGGVQRVSCRAPGALWTLLRLLLFLIVSELVVGEALAVHIWREREARMSRRGPGTGSAPGGVTTGSCARTSKYKHGNVTSSSS